MGLAEFGGGGSVKWRVMHGDKKEKKDKDTQPASGGDFVVVLDMGGTPEQFQFPIDASNPRQIQIYWPSETPLGVAVVRGARASVGVKARARARRGRKKK